MRMEGSSSRSASQSVVASSSGRAQPVKEADVLVVQVDVDEAVDLAVRDDLALEARVAAVQVVQQLADAGAFGLNGAFAADHLLEVGRHLHLYRHLAS